MKNNLKRKPQTLAIIGNGFDLNHGYKTNYSDFANSRKASKVLSEFEAYCKEELPERTWHDFENNIRELTQKLFLQSYEAGVDYEENRARVKDVNNIFAELQVLLADYLKKEIDSKPLIKKDGISQYLNDEAVALNFNYTRTAEAYTKNVIYVHGSLRENYILLGYDSREEACLAEYDDMRWYKEFEREALELRRSLRRCPFIRTKGKRYCELTDALEAYQATEISGRGSDDEAASLIPHFRKIDRFVKHHREQSLLRGIDCKSIKTVAVLGHGIEADRVYLDRILSKCDKIEKIVIYRHEKETDDEFSEKSAFLRNYSDNIISIAY